MNQAGVVVSVDQAEATNQAEATASADKSYRSGYRKDRIPVVKAAQAVVPVPAPDAVECTTQPALALARPPVPEAGTSSASGQPEGSNTAEPLASVPAPLVADSIQVPESVQGSHLELSSQSTTAPLIYTDQCPPFRLGIFSVSVSWFFPYLHYHCMRRGAVCAAPPPV
jgi:hypothetical protein